MWSLFIRKTCVELFANLGFLFFFCLTLVIRASVPKLNLDDTFEQKNEIARAVEEELEKVTSRNSKTLF